MRASEGLERCLGRVAHWLTAEGSQAPGAFAAELEALRLNLPPVPTDVVRQRLGLPVLRHWPEAMTRTSQDYFPPLFTEHEARGQSGGDGIRR